jgi:hypothetical protein
MWMKDGGSYSNVSISTITTNQMVLDGQNLDATSAAGGTLLINGVALASASGLTSSIANWASFPALSTVTYATTGGSGGNLIMNTASISTVTAAALNVSSINGVATGANSGVSRVVTGNISVQNTGAGSQSLTFPNNLSVPMVAGTWYLMTAKINITLNNAIPIANASWFYQFFLSGGTIVNQQDSPLFLGPVVFAQQNNTDANQSSYFFTTLAYCSVSGAAASLRVVATLPGAQESEFSWSCPSFNVSPLGPALNAPV